jgi:hypothetical protein
MSSTTPPTQQNEAAFIICSLAAMFVGGVAVLLRFKTKPELFLLEDGLILAAWVCYVEQVLL